MKSFFMVIFLFTFSCGYPDIDSVPDFKNLTLTKDESNDLCKLLYTDKKKLSECLDKIK